jgi:cytoskeletal protein RodZ
LNDGTALTSASEEKTLVIPPAPARKKSRFLLWLGITGLTILAGSIVAVGVLFYIYNRETVREKKSIGGNPSLSPKSSSTPKAKPNVAVENSPPVEASSPLAASEKPTPNEADDEEITPIGWDTTANGFKGETGQTYTFQCPADGTAQSIFGNDIYTQDSSICTAAVHAGIISLAEGGKVTIEYRPGRSVYGSTVRNGIKSKTWGEYPRSFVVR